MRFSIAGLLFTLCCSAQADSFTGKWVHKEGKSVESVTMQPDRDGYRATSTTEPEDLWEGFTMSFVKTNDQLLIDRDTREDRWELLPDGKAKSYMRNKPQIFERAD
jgi:hypothetical protein